MSSSNPRFCAFARGLLLLTAACSTQTVGVTTGAVRDRDPAAGTSAAGSGVPMQVSNAGAAATAGRAGSAVSSTAGTQAAQTEGAGAGARRDGAGATAGHGTAADGGATSGTAGSNVPSGGAAAAAGATAQAGASGAGAAGASGATAAGAASAPTFLLGADITDQEPAPEATRGALLQLLQQHGFNAIRLRTFVDPKARDGYDKAEGYADLAHTVAFGKQIKSAGMQLLIDFHYSDNWADPGKQCVPVAWQSYSNIQQLAAAVHDYTHDAVTQLVAGGARPDMVQVGNEITPGMLIHRCDDAGQPTGQNPVTGSTSNWKNLGLLLQSGVHAVREVDPTIKVSLHIDRGGDKASEPAGTALQASRAWLTNALAYVEIDAFGLSCYQRYQGDPNDAARTKAGWQATFTGLAESFPAIQLFAAEYGPMQREINDVVYGLAERRGLGTFNWEPTTRGDWNTGHDLVRRSGDAYLEQPDLGLYDQMQRDYAERL